MEERNVSIPASTFKEVSASPDSVDVWTAAAKGDKAAHKEWTDGEHAKKIGDGTWLSRMGRSMGATNGFCRSEYAEAVIREDCNAFAKKLMGENPTPLEVALSQRAADCYMAVQRYEWQVNQAIDFKNIEGWTRQLDKAHHRYLHTLKMLAQIRRLQLGVTVQVNIAEKQVNVAQDGAMQANVSVPSGTPALPANAEVIGFPAQVSPECRPVGE